MARKPRRVALMLDLEWPYKRHASTFAGTQRFAEEHGWQSIIDEFAHDTLPARRTKSTPYDGIIARANIQLAERATRLGVPVTASRPSQSAHRRIPSCRWVNTRHPLLC
jgi:hypothetical protein